MNDTGKLRWGTLLVLVGVLGLPLARPAAQEDPVPRGAESLLPATPWGPPVLVSPADRVKLYHWPRATTVAWRPVAGAVRYRLDREFYSGGWVAYPPVFVTGYTNTAYTFDFVGDQKGRWQVTGISDAGAVTPPSGWWTFSYSTPMRMPTPVLTSPAANTIFDNFVFEGGVNSRKTTLAWKMMPGFGYRLEIMYCTPDKKTCWPYAPVIITDPRHAYHTFLFVGAQPGKWRVTALGGTINGYGWADSTPSAWRWFRYTI